MKSEWKKILVSLCILAGFSTLSAQAKIRVGLLIMATGKYVQFVGPLVESAERYFVPNCERTYFIFTDHVDQVPQALHTVPLFQSRLAWPYDTMMRCVIPRGL